MTPPGLAIELDKDRLGFVGDPALEARDVVGIGPLHAPAEILERMVELVDRAAVELARGDKLVARLHQRMERHHLSGMSGGDRQSRGAAFERGDALLQHGIGGIADAGIDVAEGLQPEQRGGVIDILEYERSGLIDRRGAGAGRRLGLRAGMDRQRRKARGAVCHCWFHAEEEARGGQGEAGAVPGQGGERPLDVVRAMRVEQPRRPIAESSPAGGMGYDADAQALVRRAVLGGRVSMLTLYYAPGACSMASHIVLEESDERYQGHKVNLAGGEQRTQEYLKKNPQGRVPLLELDNGDFLAENTAILPYLGKRFGLWPSDDLAEARALSLIGFFAASVHPAHAHVGRPERYTPDTAAHASIKETGLKTFHNYLKQIDAMLADREWLGNSYSVVDPYGLVFYAWGVRRELPMDELKNYTAFKDRMLQRPAVAKVAADEGVKL